MRVAALVLLSCSILGGCVAAVDPVTRNLPLRMALTEPVPVLEARAAEGDRQAQYAVSFLAKLGLRGVPQDPVRAEGLRAQAGEIRRRSQPIYVPGVNGNPGTLTYVPITDPGVSDEEARRLDLCAFTLMVSQPALGGQVCGSPEAYIDLLPAAVEVRSEMLLSAILASDFTRSVDPQSVTECEATDPLWASAASRHRAGNIDLAKAASDRIIALCGEQERSWHARVMRATLALDDGDAALALDLLQPVPSPAPYPIGAFGEHIRIAALQAAGRSDDATATRDALAAASLAALTSEAAAAGASVERRPLGDATLVLFDRRSYRYVPGLVSLKTMVVEGEPARLTAYQLTRSGTPAGMEGPWFLDAFSCEDRATLTMFETEPSLDEIATRVAAYRGDPASALSRSLLRPASSGDVCAWPFQVAPGLGDDPENIPANVRIEFTGPPLIAPDPLVSPETTP